MEIDLELPFREITPQFFNRLNMFAPFGPENMKPLFLARGVTSAGSGSRKVGALGEHLKLRLVQPDCAVAFDGIAFGLGADWGEPVLSGEPVDVLFTLDENEWNGKTTIQLMIEDIRLSDPEADFKKESSRMQA
jgi:single-stranded-DNA-specific exonuclease